jgi:hypothetical protein
MEYDNPGSLKLYSPKIDRVNFTKKLVEFPTHAKQYLHNKSSYLGEKVSPNVETVIGAILTTGSLSYPMLHLLGVLSWDNTTLAIATVSQLLTGYFFLGHSNSRFVEKIITEQKKIDEQKYKK